MDPQNAPEVTVWFGNTASAHLAWVGDMAYQLSGIT